MASAEEFELHRSHLFGLAYRMLGSAADAEDMVQDAFLKWRDVDEATVNTPRAFLSTIVARKSIDRLRSLKSRREDYVGTWLPEPLVMDASDAEAGTLLAESISMAFLVLLEQLSPVERAAFLLREVFDYGYDDVARITGKSEANCRQICRRARDRVTADRPRFETSSDKQLELTGRFLTAVGAGDLSGLEELLSDDITIWSDGGGKASAARNVITGPARAAQFMLGVAGKFLENVSTRFAVINGQPGLVSTENGALYSVTVLEIANDRIIGVRIIRNPDKLARIAAD